MSSNERRKRYTWFRKRAKKQTFGWTGKSLVSDSIWQVVYKLEFDAKSRRRCVFFYKLEFDAKKVPLKKGSPFITFKIF